MTRKPTTIQDGNVPEHWWANGYRKGESYTTFMAREAHWAVRRIKDGKFYMTVFNGKSVESSWVDSCHDTSLKTSAEYDVAHLASKCEAVWVGKVPYEKRGK